MEDSVLTGRGSSTVDGGGVFDESAKAALETDGYCVVEGVLSDDELEALRSRLDQQAAGEQAARVDVSTGLTTGDGDTAAIGGANLVPDFLRKGVIAEADNADFEQGGTGDQRVANLVNKGRVFRDLCVHPLMKSMASTMLGSPFLLGNCSANIVRTPRAGQPLHSDVHYMPPSFFSICLGINVFWLLDDYTEDNGATRVVAGTHNQAHKDLVRDEAIEAQPVIAPAGSAFAFDTRLLHGAGPNTTGRPRRAIITVYTRFFFRQNENFALEVAPAALEDADADLWDMMGFRVHSILGGVDGHYGVGAVKKNAAGDADAAGLSGFFVDRPTTPTGPLAADGHPLATTA